MDIDLRYIEKGSGDILVLLHGNGESSLYFKNQIEYFSKIFRVIAIDTRGHGKSPRGKAPFTIRRFAADLYEFFMQKGIDKANILGFSDGANIALEFALRHSECVEKLILCGANLYPSGLCLWLRAFNRISYAVLSFLCLFSPKFIKKRSLLRLMVKEPDIDPEALKSLNMPSLVMAGSRDVIREDHTRLIADSLANARLCILPGPHSLAAKSPEAFNRVTADFLLMQQDDGR